MWKSATFLLFSGIIDRNSLGSRDFLVLWLTASDFAPTTAKSEESSQKYIYYRRPIEDPSETNMHDWRPVGDRHAKLETHGRPIGDSSETYRRPSWDQFAWSETNMHDGRPQHASLETPPCFSGDPSKTNMPHRRPTCHIDNLLEPDMFGLRPAFLISDHRPTFMPIGDTLETDMPHRWPTRDRHAWLESLDHSNIYK